MGNLGLYLKAAMDRSQERERGFLALGYREGMDELMAGLDEEERGLFEERAGIMEHDGGLTKPEAERLALSEILTNPNGSKGGEYGL